MLWLLSEHSCTRKTSDRYDATSGYDEGEEQAVRQTKGLHRVSFKGAGGRSTLVVWLKILLLF